MPTPGRRTSPPRRRAARLDLDSLNPPQREAVLYDGGPMLVLAGAGSGKTRVIIHRIARLLQDGVAPQRILGVTFTNKAAREMRQRLTALAGEAGGEVHLSTFHSLGLTILREEQQAAGLRRGFCIYDESDQLSLVRELLRRVQVADRRLDVPRLLGMILDTKRAGLKAFPIQHDDDYELAAHALYPRYLEQMRAYNAVDFDDLLLRACSVVEQAEPRARWSQRYDQLLVDEYQDTSPDQLALLRVLAGEKRQVCAVGDDDQSIYAWRGADAASILAFGKDFPGTREIVLDQNYRSTGNILAAANAVIAHNEVRKPKKMWCAAGDGDPVEVVACTDAEDEAVLVYQQIRSLLDDGAVADDIAVLYRANAQSRTFEEKLTFEAIPYRVVGGQAFLERKEVKDLLAYLVVARNPSDEVSLRRVLNVPPRGIGPTSVERLVMHGEARHQGMWAAVQQAEGVSDLPPAAVIGARDLANTMNAFGPRLRDARPGQLSTAVRELVQALGLREHILKADDAPSVSERRLENLDEVIHSVAAFEREHPRARDLLGDYLDLAMLRSKTEEENAPPGGKVTLMTLHSAKGLEFPYVFLVGIEEDLLPHRRSIELGGDICEERRLCYVGMTRARRHLWLTLARRRRRHGKELPRTPSRFLDELPAGDGVVRRDRDEPLQGEAADNMANDFFARMQARLADDDGGSAPD
ncbi:MAG: UvrD-helicase domain-containing protein [Pseudomonadota bacterium]